MKRVVLGLMLALVAGVVFGQANVPAIVVSSFQTRGQAITADDAESITELFIAALARTGQLRVVDRSSLERVIAEMRFQTSDWANPQRTASLGQALNASFIVQGQLNQLGQNISVAITTLDIRTLEVVSSATNTFDVDRIFNPNAFTNHGWGNITHHNIFGAMPNMAGNISQTMTTRLANAERQRQEDEQRREQEAVSLVGTWVARGNNFNCSAAGISNAENNMEITFRHDGTLSFTVNRAGLHSWHHDTTRNIIVSSGSGHYTRNGNELTVSWDRHDSTRHFQRHHVFTHTTGSGRNARRNYTIVWRETSNSNRQQQSFVVIMEFSNNGRDMRLSRRENEAWPDWHPVQGRSQWEPQTIPTLFVRQ